jgi:UrcA family protein
MKTTLIAAALTVAAITTAGSAYAADSSDRPLSLDVPYSDLNLASRAGATAMLSRLRNAATIVCGGRPHRASAQEASAYRACVRTAVEGAVRQINAPLLAELYYGERTQSDRLADRR